MDEDKKEVKFTEMLRESGSGISSGDSDLAPGFGFKKETFRTGVGPRQGVIEQQSDLFGKQYSYTFDFKKVRSAIEEAATQEGYTFSYQITPAGL